MCTVERFITLKESVISPFVRNVIQNVALSRTLLAKESDSLCLFDSTEGIIYTLPPPIIGLQFDFLVTVSVLAPRVYKVITDASTSILSGDVVMGDTASQHLPVYFSSNSVTDIAIESNGSTTGGRIGGYYRITALSTTEWFIKGNCNVEGVAVSPFKTS